MNFLESIARHIHKKYADQLDSICVVLPNKRAGLFLKKHLHQVFGKAIVVPQIVGFDDFIYELTALEPIDHTELLFELYAIHHQLEKKENIRSFEEFIDMGNVLLSDFNEVDMHCVDALQIFNYLSETKAIQLWNVQSAELTEFQQNYLFFYRSLSEYYRQLQQRLQHNQRVYAGMAYRYAAENIVTLSDHLPYTQIIFAGFNALTRSEEMIFDYLGIYKNAEIHWDADDYYLNNPQNEAGALLRKYNEKSPFPNVSTSYKETKNIEVVGISKSIGQVKQLSEILEELHKQGSKDDETAVVLADERLLIPVLNSLPANIKNVNVTMGYPLRFTPIYEFVQTIFNLQKLSNRIRKDKNTDAEIFLYHNVDLEKVIKHSYFKYLVHSPFDVEFLSEKAFFTLEEILQALNCKENECIGQIFDKWKTTEQLFDALNVLLLQLSVVKFSGSPSSVETEFIIHFTKLVQRLEKTHVQYHAFDNLNIFYRIFKQLAQTTSIPFYGEPLAGLQIMGLLETRTLDFKNVILLSANEGILPSSNRYSAHIPHDVKKDFGLPLFKEYDAVFAYHFYHLLQRAQNIYLLYNTDASGLGSRDKSRFISQLMYELPAYNPDIQIKECVVNVSSADELPDDTIRIQKSKEIIESLAGLAERGFSPSLLNRYINCSLQFYFSAIVGIREPEEAELHIDARILGNVIHKVLEKIYVPELNKPLQKEILQNAIEKAEELITDEFRLQYRANTIDEGKNLFTVKLAEMLLVKFLKQEISLLSELSKQNQELTILQTEQRIEHILPVESGDKVYQILLKGYADRIDQIGNTIRILDYKTGFVGSSDLNAKELEEVFQNPQYAKSLQLLVYTYLYRKQHPDLRQVVESELISFRKMETSFKVKYLQIDNTTESEFEQHLTNLLSEIYNPHLPFEQTDVVDNCRNCEYKDICRR